MCRRARSSDSIPADTPVPQSEREAELAPTSAAQDYVSVADAPSNDDNATPLSAEDGQSWEGDGTQEFAPDDGEWGGDAKAHGNNLGSEDDVDAGELARTQETLQAHLHAQALTTWLGDEDRIALRFLIESLNEDGYLEDTLEELAAGLAPTDEDEMDQLQHHFPGGTVIPCRASTPLGWAPATWESACACNCVPCSDR